MTIAPKPEQHPFQPGVKVAVVSRARFGDSVSFREAVVAKIYKNGNFCLEGSAQQWCPERAYLGNHCAFHDPALSRRNPRRARANSRRDVDRPNIDMGARRSGEPRSEGEAMIDWLFDDGD